MQWLTFSPEEDINYIIKSDRPLMKNVNIGTKKVTLSMNKPGRAHIGAVRQTQNIHGIRGFRKIMAFRITTR